MTPPLSRPVFDANANGGGLGYGGDSHITAGGLGEVPEGEPVEGEVAFDPKWLRDLGADPRALSIIRVEGDSMAPTLDDGDDILVDGGDAAARLRDGIYVLRMDDVLMVKRLARAPGGRLSVLSDNPVCLLSSRN